MTLSAEEGASAIIRVFFDRSSHVDSIVVSLLSRAAKELVVRSPNLLKPLGPTDVRQGMSGVSRMQHVAVGQVLNLLDGRTIRQPTKISRTCEAPPPYIPDNG